MRFIIESGTDVAAVAAGDPSLLGTLRECRGTNYDAVRDAAIANGSLWRAETGADGAYLVHVFVDEDPPADVTAWLRDPLAVKPFHLPSGRLLVAGEECFVGALDVTARPHMGQEVAVPAGQYALTAYRVEVPDNRVEQRFAATATAGEQRAWRTGSAAPGWCIIGTLAALVVAYFAYIRTASVVAAALPLAAGLAAWAWCYQFRSRPLYVEAETRFRTIEREVPSIVLVLRAS